MINTKTGYLHLLLALLLMFGSIVYKTIRMFFVFYIECELLSWIVFKKECLISYSYKKDKNSNYTLGKNFNLEDMELPDWLHYIGYIVRVYFYSTMSTWYYSLVLGCYYLLMRIDKNIIHKSFWLSNWRYLLIPIVLYLFHGYNAPFNFFAKKKHKTTIYVSIIVFALYLGSFLFKYPNTKELYKPMIISYSLLAFIGIGTRYDY